MPPNTCWYWLISFRSSLCVGFRCESLSSNICKISEFWRFAWPRSGFPDSHLPSFNVSSSRNRLYNKLIVNEIISIVILLKHIDMTCLSVFTPIRCVDIITETTHFFPTVWGPKYLAFKGLLLMGKRLRTWSPSLKLFYLVASSYLAFAFIWADCNVRTC